MNPPKRRISDLKPWHKAFIISTYQTITYHNQHRPESERSIHYCYKLRETIARDMARMGIRGRNGRPYSVQRISQIAAELDQQWHLITRQKRYYLNPDTREIEGKATRVAFYRKFGAPGIKFIGRLVESWVNEFAGLGAFFSRKKKKATDQAAGDPAPGPRRSGAGPVTLADIFSQATPAPDPAPG